MQHQPYLWYFMAGLDFPGDFVLVFLCKARVHIREKEECPMPIGACGISVRKFMHAECN